MDDNARPHRARLVNEYLQSENIRRMDRPARSPDLNPLEHVWDALGRRIGARHPSPRTLVELRTALLEEWGLLPLNLLQSLVNSMRARCETLIAVRASENCQLYGFHFCVIIHGYLPADITIFKLRARLTINALFEANPEEFVSRFVTMDETWAHHFTPESKQQSMQWRHSGSPPPKKAKTVPSAGKVMVSVFWESEGVLLLDFLNKGQTITGNYYANLVKQL
ncbi:hypothetical protein LAZ67_11002072 [Cordylochernes scorpioides]|uniref:Tc1-like transposase DDE domain-containing protein n=1 Tax=Cordylochernes scorpioides TaxID=51811 RepID=A0ABY6KYZ3_9ARAC|nr:hypothetical protein LAZ67_11002072 [Cordylochernes scorpioides]